MLFRSYSGYYSVINNCNLLLKYSDLAFNNDKSFTLEALNEYKAQAIAIRSLLYFHLARTFGDIPFPLEGYSENSQQLTIAKTSQSDVFKTITNHLEEIVDNNHIPVKYSNTNAAMNKGYVTRYAVDALLADIYLWTGEYQKCVNVCNEVINSGQFALVAVDKVDVESNDGEIISCASFAGGDNLFQTLYVDGNSVESIFELQFAKDIANPFYSYFVNSSRRYMIPNDSHINADIFVPTAKEGMSGSYIDVRKSIATKGGYMWKWAGVSYSGSDVFAASEDMTNNLIVYRYAQILLMKAEALTQLAIESGNQNQLEEALALVDEVRNRAGAVEATEFKRELNGSIDAKQLESYLIEEYSREFLFEGKRWFDILRNSRRNDYANINYLMQTVTNSVYSDKVYSVQVKYRDYNSHYLPLPQYDIETNNLLVQNPFYDTSNK